MVQPLEQIAPPKTNFDLLLERLPKDSLAAALVTAHIKRGTASSVEAMRQVLNDQLAGLRVAHDEHQDQ